MLLGRSAIFIGMKNVRFLALKGALVASTFLAAAAAQAADPQVEALLAKMRAAYQGTKAISYKTETHIGSKSYLSTFTFQSPSTIKVNLAGVGAKQPAGVTLSTDGKTITVRAPHSPLPIVTNYTVDKFNSNIAGNLESICFYDWARQLSTAPGKNMEHSDLKIMPNQDWNGKKWTVLQEIAPKDKVACRYYIDPRTNLIWRTTVKNISGVPSEKDVDSFILKMGPPGSIDDSKMKVIHV